MPMETARESLQHALGDAYELGDLVGRGGFAEVFVAHEKRLKRDVAVKAIRPDLVLTERLLERFQHEAEAIARVRHPNIIEIYFVGGSERTAFFVMPLVEGETLEQRLSAEGRLTHEEATRLLRETAGALAAAHAAGVVHRDIKPANLLLEGPHRRLLVTDFGIAKALQEEKAAATGAGILVGTPQYMSPEQATGDPLDHRSDLYSLGVVAYQMVTGRLPFEGDSARAIILKHITEDAEPVRSRRPDCPERLALVIERCLAKEPSARFQNARELVDALAPGASSLELAGSKGVSGDGQAPQPVRRFRGALLAAGVASVTAALVEVAIFGQVAVSLLLWVAAFVYAATRYGRMWTAGFGLRDALGLRGRTSGPGGAGTISSHESGPEFQVFGGHTGIVRECRAERARIVLLFEELSRAEQGRLGSLVTQVDHLVARVRRVARQLASLEGRTAFEEQAVARAVGSSEVGFLGHDTTIAELQDAREEKALELRAAVERLGETRRLLERSAAGDTAEALGELLATWDEQVEVR